MAKPVLTPTLPAATTLARFFLDRPPYTTHEAAQLLGWMEPQLVCDLRDEGALLPGAMVAWEDVASRLILAWPRRELLQSLGASAPLVPEGLEVVPVTWMLPRYVVLAIEVQAKLRNGPNPEIHTTEPDDYVADLLHLSIEPETAQALGATAGFLEAYHFPHGPGGDE